MDWKPEAQRAARTAVETTLQQAGVQHCSYDNPFLARGIDHDEMMVAWCGLLHRLVDIVRPVATPDEFDSTKELADCAEDNLRRAGSETYAWSITWLFLASVRSIVEQTRAERDDAVLRVARLATFAREAREARRHRDALERADEEELIAATGRELNLGSAARVF